MQKNALKKLQELDLGLDNLDLIELIKLIKYNKSFNEDMFIDYQISQKFLNLEDPLSKRFINLIKEFNIRTNSLTKIIKIINDLSKIEFRELVEPYILNTDITATKSLHILVAKILAHKPNILDFCSGQGSFLAEYAKRNPKSNLFGIEIDNDFALSSKLNLDILGYSNFIFNEDALSNNTLFKDKMEFKAIFSNFPINLIGHNFKKSFSEISYFSKYQFKSSPIRDYNWLFAMHVVNLITNQGKAVVLAPLNMLFRESQIDIRNEFLKKGLVETIIQLPDRTLNYSPIPMALLILSNDNEMVRLVDATDAFEASRRVNHLRVDEILSRMKSDGEFSITLSNEKLIQNHASWLPRNIILNVEFDYDGQPLENVIEDIFRGAQIKRSEYETMREPLKDNFYTKYQMVSLSSFDESIDPERLETIYTPKALYDRYILKNHDILLTSRGTLFKLGLVELDSDENLIATGNVAVLRVNPIKINPIYLYMFLKSTKGERLLESIRKGSSILVINNKDVLELKIPVIPMGKQEVLAERYMRLKAQRALIQRRLDRIAEDITALYDVAGDI